MQLAQILMIITVILSLLAGFLTFFGAASEYRSRAGVYAVSCLLLSVWTVLEFFFKVELPFPTVAIYLDLLFLAAVWVLYRLSTRSKKRDRAAYGALLCGLVASGLIAAIFGLLLTGLQLCWLAPTSFVAVVIAHFYATLRYRLVILNQTYLRLLADVIIVAVATIIYMVIFFLVLTKLFKFPADSSSTIIILNFIMVVIVFMLFPVINEAMAYLHSLTTVGQVNLFFII